MERQMLLSNPLVEDHTMVLSWFSYKRGIGNSNYGLGTAIGVFQSAAVSYTHLATAFPKRANAASSSCGCKDMLHSTKCHYNYFYRCV